MHQFKAQLIKMLNAAPPASGNKYAVFGAAAISWLTRYNSQGPAHQEITDCERIAFRQQFEKLLQKNSSNNSLQNQASKPTQPVKPQRPAQHLQNHNQTQRPSDHCNGWPSTQQQFPWELRARMRRLRAERDEEVRRELAVGTGPEVQRP